MKRKERKKQKKEKHKNTHTAKRCPGIEGARQCGGEAGEGSWLRVYYRMFFLLFSL